MIKIDPFHLVKSLLNHGAEKKEIVDLIWLGSKGELTLNQANKIYDKAEEEMHDTTSLDQCTCNCPEKKPKDHAVNCVYRINCLK